jgi:hypothetical protein
LATEKFGPDFEEAGSRIYRAEYGVISFAILGYLAWRAFYGGGIDALQTVFWALFPDLAAFTPIGLSSKRREWPRWGAHVYDAVHNLITWVLVFFVFLLVIRVPSWPLLGWLGHIAVDRTVGYGLRKLPEKS